MRRLLLQFLTLGLLLATACQRPALPSPFTPTSRQTRQPATATQGQPSQSPTASIDFNAVFRQLADQLGSGPFLDPGMAGDIQRSLVAFLNTRANRQQSIDRQPTVIEDLRSTLDVSPTGEPQVTIVDADGDERLDVLVTLPVSGVPGFIIRHAPGGFVGHPVPKSGGVAVDGPITFERVDDLNGDGVPEVTLTTRIVGASAVNTLITVVQWDGQTFQTRLQTGISNWAGEAGWEFVDENGTEALVTQCPALGAYDHKLLPHPELTRIFRWQDDRLALDQTTLVPPQTVREQVNIAESAFRKGQLEAALVAYSRAAEDMSLVEYRETADIAWRAYAKFRIGQIEALRGNPDAAREAMEVAQAAGPALSDLATAFLDSYSNGNAARALAALRRVNLHERFYLDSGGNLGPPMDPDGILYSGLAVAAYLNTHPDAGQGSGESLTETLRDLGLDVAGSAIVDLDNSGRAEVLVVLKQTVPQELSPEGRRQTLWLLTPHNENTWWPRSIETASNLTLTQTAPTPEGDRRAVVYQRPENTSPTQAAISWNGTQVLRYNVSSDDELTPISQAGDPFQCTIP